MKNDRQWRDEAEEREAVAQEGEESVRYYVEEFCKIRALPPEVLEPRVLSETQRGMVKNACEKELAAVEGTKRVAATIDDFAVFCGLLAKPENHMRIKGQYIERQVPLRQEADMVNEMARVLTSLPKYTAYARIVEEKGGEPIVWKGRIRTVKLTDAPAEGADTARAAIENALRYCRGRQEIEREIKGRQEKWRVRVEAPSVRHCCINCPERRMYG